MVAANENIAFSGNARQTAEAQFRTAASSYCLHKHSVQTV